MLVFLSDLSEVQRTDMIRKGGGQRLGLGGGLEGGVEKNPHV